MVLRAPSTICIQPWTPIGYKYSVDEKHLFYRIFPLMFFSYTNRHMEILQKIDTVRKNIVITIRLREKLCIGTATSSVTLA